MNDKNIAYIEDRALALCEEFCRYVVVDTGNSSLLTNTGHEFYHELSNRLKNLGYVEIFKACVHPHNTITSTFLLLPANKR